jgi:hypothetical protein
MNLPKAISDHGPTALSEIDARISAILKELAALQTRRVSIVMHLSIEEAIGSLSPMVVVEEGLEDAE